MAGPLPSAPLVEAARRARRLGILGGSFDPPHLGHLHVLRRARAAFELEHVVLVPAARPPHKPERILADGDERLAMLACLLEEEPGVSVWDIELGRSGPSYSVDTLRALRACLPAPARLFLILGEDNLAGFPGWRDVEEIVALAQPIVVHRSPAALQEALERPAVRALSSAVRVALSIGRLGGPKLDLCSTELRAALARGEWAEDAFPPRLAEYLRRGNPYRRP